MNSDSPTGFLTRPEAARLYNRSQRALERDLDMALRVGDSNTLSHWRLLTKDGQTREASDASVDMVKQLQGEGRLPVWYVEEIYLEKRFGRRGMPMPDTSRQKTPVGESTPTIDAHEQAKLEQSRNDKTDPLRNDVEFLKERIRTLEQEKREEAKRNEEREAKLFEQLAVKDKQIGNWDEITQGLMRGLATGQLRPDAGTMVLAAPVANGRNGVADSELEDAAVVQQGAKPSKLQKQVSPDSGGANNGQSRSRTKPAATKKAANASSATPKWYEMPTFSRFLTRK